MSTPLDEFVKIVNSSTTISECIIKLGWVTPYTYGNRKPYLSGSGYKSSVAAFRRACNEHNISTDHFKKNLIDQNPDKLREIVKQSTTIHEAIQKLGYVISGSTYTSFKNACEYYEISIAHFVGNSKGNLQYSLDEILVENSPYSDHNANGVKKRLFKEHIFEKKCYKCGLVDWNNAPISLELEHINGNRKDYRLENLTILCPNCHSQTEFYKGRNYGRYSPRS